MRVPTLERETALWAQGHEVVVGLDEVGRGPLAGPVVAGAVVFQPRQAPIEGLRDSKSMTALSRERAAREVRAQALAWAVGAASVHEIDRFNIRGATALAMRRALARLRVAPDYVLVDGSPFPELGTAHEAIVRGDGTCLTIAAASVLAKCVRDRLMLLLARRYPGFGWDHNKGYATRSHLNALDRSGPTPHHRSSFSPVVQPRFL
ncbi:MAG: ribonuclease HII [Gemmatimonadales bacterium]